MLTIAIVALITAFLVGPLIAILSAIGFIAFGWWGAIIGFIIAFGINVATAE